MLSLAAVFEDIHNPPVFRTSSNITGYGTFFLLWLAPDQCMISSFNGMIRKLSGQKSHGEFGFGDHEKAGSVFVNPVNKPRTAFSVSAGWQLLKVIHQTIYQCACPVAECRDARPYP